MKLARNPGPAVRGAFTLIEMLTVIAIIAILVALTAAAVMKTLSKGPQTTTRVEIGQMEGSVTAFQNKYGVSYIPSRIILRKYLDDYYDPKQGGGTQLDLASVAYLTLVFHSSPQKFAANWKIAGGGINWHSGWSALAATAHPAELLEGEQCLVFFLGGIPAISPNGCLGFSTDDSHPDALGGTRNSFYEFKSSRLALPTGKSYFFAYQDAYRTGKFYAYFSSYGKDNGYNPYAGMTNPPASDCATLGVWPYAESFTPTARYVKPKTCQILSAGADGVFGPGTDLNSKAPFLWNTQGGGSGPAAADDQANFAPNLVGGGP